MSFVSLINLEIILQGSVPAIALSGLSLSLVAILKSDRYAWPDASKRIFYPCQLPLDQMHTSGFISLCTIPFECKYSNAQAISAITVLVSSYTMNPSQRDDTSDHLRFLMCDLRSPPFM